MIYINNTVKKRQFVILGFIFLCVTFSGMLIYREIDARKIPPLVLESASIALDNQTVDSIIMQGTGKHSSTQMKIESFMPDAPNDKVSSDIITSTTKEPRILSSHETRRISGSFGTLSIRNKTFSLESGIDEKTLKKNIGWMESSAPPGSDGICVIMGHRNTQFRILKDVEKGDEVIISDDSGAVYTYIVQSGLIVESDSDFLFEASEGETLALVTCFPFHYKGNAPQKYVVIAKLALLDIP